MRKLAMKIAKLVLSAVVLLSSNAGLAKTLRPNELGKGGLQRFLQGQSDDVIEFREGDQIPVALKVDGDILQSASSEPTMVEVKKGFFLKFESDELRMSWDGTEYLPYRDLIRGQLEAKASGDSAVSNIEINFSAFVKE
jgi:hypothetical protein